nr:unnamed protein product [Callosobruchus chinensis]
MPYRCCVPNCSGNYGYGDAPKVTVFSFPEDENLRKEWLQAIPRANFVPSNTSKVCELHFQEHEIIRDVEKLNKKTGESSNIPLKRLRLKVGAIPSKFSNCPKYLSKPTCSVRKSRNKKIRAVEHANLLKALKESQEEFVAHQESISFQNFDKLLEILVPFNKNGWCKVIENSKVVFFKIEYVPGPTANYSVLINSELKMETYLCGHQISIDLDHIKTPCHINNLETLESCLASVDSFSAKNGSNNGGSHKLKQIVNHVTSILDNLDFDDSDKKDAFNFLSEQLKLQISPKERYRYSANTMIWTSILHTISSHAYKYLRHYSSLILPHPSTIKTVCNTFLTDPTDEDKKLFMAYAQNVYKFIENHEKHVILLMDEIHIQPYLDFKGGNIVGTAFDGKSLATSAYTFMISSVTSKLKEVVHIYPTSTIESNTLFICIKTVIVKLEEIGYKVFCVISDNNALNGKAMNNFSPKKELSIVYPHPCDNRRPLFFLFDSVHLLKCIRNNWINTKNNKTLTYPDFETGEKKFANFNSLIRLHQLEHHKLLKFGYSLSLKALLPTTFERQNVNLCLKIFNPFVIEALLNFGTNIEHSTETASFINIILTWWKIVNVKTPFKGQRLLDNLQSPINSTPANSDDPKLLFLSKMINWLDKWKSDDFPNKLSSQTHTALLHTLHGMLEIVKYCFEELNLNYVLLGKFQTDPLENRFGKYRQLAGGQYHISIRQLYESEKKLRIQSLFKIFSKNLDDFHHEQRQLDYSFHPQICIENSDYEQVQYEMPVITYLAGYCCYKILRKIKCDICKLELVYDDDLVVEENYNLISSLNRGGLLFPKDIVIRIVLICYIIFNKILANHEDEFLSTHYKRDCLIDIFLKYWLLNESENNKLKLCHNHEEENIVKLVIASTTNTLLKNYCSKSNDRLGKTKKRKLDTVAKK